MLCIHYYICLKIKTVLMYANAKREQKCGFNAWETFKKATNESQFAFCSNKNASCLVATKREKIY